MDFRRERIAAAQAILASIFASQRALKSLAPEYVREATGNLLGDFGELIATDHSGLDKGPPGCGDFDARSAEGKTVRSRRTAPPTKLDFEATQNCCS